MLVLENIKPKLNERSEEKATKLLLNLQLLSVFDLETVTGKSTKEFKIALLELRKEIMDSKNSVKDVIQTIPDSYSKEEKK